MKTRYHYHRELAIYYHDKRINLFNYITEDDRDISDRVGLQGEFVPGRKLVQWMNRVRGVSSQLQSNEQQVKQQACRCVSEYGGEAKRLPVVYTEFTLMALQIRIMLISSMHHDDTSKRED